MDRREFLKNMGIAGAVIVGYGRTPMYMPMPGEKSKEDDTDIFFAKYKGSIYLLFHNRDRIFKETKDLSEDEWGDMAELKQRLVDNLIDYYAKN